MTEKQASNIYRTFKIYISQELKLKCSLINETTQEEIIVQLNQSDPEEYSLHFAIENNNIQFMKDLINDPEDYKLYTIQYQKKEYHRHF
jgi:hypothetical protein